MKKQVQDTQDHTIALKLEGPGLPFGVRRGRLVSLMPVLSDMDPRQGLRTPRCRVIWCAWDFCRLAPRVPFPGSLGTWEGLVTLHGSEQGGCSDHLTVSLQLWEIVSCQSLLGGLHAWLLQV